MAEIRVVDYYTSEILASFHIDTPMTEIRQYREDVKVPTKIKIVGLIIR